MFVSSLVYFLLSLFWCSCTPAMAVFMSSSKLDLCSTTTSTAASSALDNATLRCTEKFVLTFSVEGGDVASDTITTWGQTIDARTQVPVQLVQPLHIRVTRSAPKMLYPLYYVREFNAKPYEVAIYRGLLGCNADSTSSQPTCGRQVHPLTGVPIPYSEGYCCSCSLCSLLHLCDEGSRANTNCNLFGTAQSASCLRFGEQWYSGYKLGPAIRSYTITINITDDLPGGFTRVLHVSPSVPGALSDELDFTASLVGDFSSFVQPWDLTQYVLFAPSQPLSDPLVSRGPAEWMLIPSLMVTVDGTECNKVGVSYEGFVTQGGDRCKLRAGSCTQKQLSDLRAMDAAAVAGGKQPTYLVSAFGDVTLVTDRTTTMQPYLGFTARGVGASVVTLSFAADRIAYVQHVATGQFLAVNLSRSGPLTSYSRDGVLYVSFLNTGQIGAKFTVTVTQCAETTFPLLAEIAAVEALHVKTVSFAISAQTDATTGEVQACNVTLYDALSRVVDRRVIAWNVTARVPDKGPQGGGGGSMDGSPVLIEEDGGSSTGCPSCPFYNPLCFLQQKCFWGFVVQVGSIALLIAALVFLARFTGCIGRCCQSNGRGGGGGGGGEVVVVHGGGYPYEQPPQPVIAHVLDMYTPPSHRTRKSRHRRGSLSTFSSSFSPTPLKKRRNEPVDDDPVAFEVSLAPHDDDNEEDGEDPSPSYAAHHYSHREGTRRPYEKSHRSFRRSASLDRSIAWVPPPLRADADADGGEYVEEHPVQWEGDTATWLQASKKRRRFVSREDDSGLDLNEYRRNEEHMVFEG